MKKNLLFALVILILTIVLIVSPDFKEIAGGVAIFLFGMRFLQEGFKSFTGGSFEKLLQKSTDKTWKGMIFGFCASSIMQSSSLVSIITVSFLSAGLISLLQGISIIMGSALGNTTGIWLIAGFGMKMNIAALGMPMIVLGIICVFQKSKIIKGVGNVLAGLGFVFLGIHYMKVGFESFSSTIDLTQYAVEGYLGVIVFTLIGLLMTIVMQSSHATIMLVLAALATGQVSFDNALALTIGANLGTSVTSFIVSLTGNKDGKRVGLSDLLMKTTASIIIIIFFYQFFALNELLANIFNMSPENYPLKLALFHTLFNVVGVGIMLLGINKFIVVLKKVFPDEKTNVYGSIYLQKEMVELPSAAILSLIKETRHLYYNTVEVLLQILGLKYNDIEGFIDFEKLKKKIKIVELEDIDTFYNKKIKYLYGEILDYATNAEASNDERYADDFKKIKQANRKLVEVVKDMKHLHKNLKRYLRSTNLDIKTQYENIVYDLILMIKDINKLQSAKSQEGKLLIFVNIKRKIKENNIINNGTLDKLIRERKISNEMATSLINDSNYKKDMFKDLLNSSEIIYNNDISQDITEIDENSEEGLLHEHFGLSKREITKAVNKYKIMEEDLKKKMKIEEDESIKKGMETQLDDINYFIKKYEK